jgi:hypothetical protein
MKNRIAQLTFFILSISISQAQPFKVGVEGGVSAALGKISYGYINKITSTGPRLGARFGLPLQFQMSKNGALHSGIYYAMKGISKQDNSLVGLVYNSIEVPVAFVYKTNRPDAGNFFIGGGVYIGYAISGKIHSYYINGQQASESIRFGNTILEHDMRRLDYGLHFQTGWSFRNGLLLRLVAQKQLNNMATNNNGFSFSEVKNQAYAAFTMAYLF